MTHNMGKNSDSQRITKNNLALLLAKLGLTGYEENARIFCNNVRLQ
jgi:hypothetical protein